MGTILDAKMVISAQDKTGAVFDQIAKKLNGIAKNKKAAAAVDQLSQAMGRAREQLTAIDRFNLSRGKTFGAFQSFREAEKNVASLARAMASVEKPTAEMESNFKRAQKAASSASKAYETHRTALRANKLAMSDLGVPIMKAATHQARLNALIEQSNAAVDKHAAKQERRQISAERWTKGIAVAGAAVAAGSRVKTMGKSAIVSAAEFDIGTRKQREFTDITAADQSRILTPQARRIGQDTQFSNLDVVKAQTATMQGLPTSIAGRDKAEVAAGIMENVKNYALVMEADLSTSAEGVRSFLQTTGKDISTKEKAVAESTKAVNQLVRMAKLGGMSDDDVQSYLRYGAASATSAGVDTETMLSLGALARRGGLRGDAAGTFMRAAAGKLVAPTKGGLTALNSAGINYSDFVRMPSSLDPNRLEGQFKQDLGKGFSPQIKASLAKALADPKVLGDRGAFTEAVTNAVAPMFGDKMKAADRAKVARSAGSFYKTSAESVNSQGLLDRIMESDMTLAQLNAFFTDKHGGKASITQRQREEYVAARKQLRAAGDDPDYAKRKADEIMGGLGGSFERLKGSVENLTLSIGNAMEPLARPGFDKLGAAIDAVSNLPGAVLGTGAAVAGGASVFGAGALVAKMMSGFGLTSSAVALDGAAVALTAAATSLAGGKVADAAVKGGTAAAAAGGAAGGAASIWSRIAGAARFGIGAAIASPFLPVALMGGGLMMTGGYDAESAAKNSSRQGRVRNAYRQQWAEDRERQGVPTMPNPPQADATADAIRAKLASWGVGAGAGGSGGAGETVKAIVEGTATLETTVTVSPSPDFLAKVDQRVNNGINAFRSTGGTPTGSTGSTGRSMPEAGAPQ